MSWEDVMVEYVLPGSMWLFIIAAIGAFVFGSVMSVVGNPKGIVRSLVAIVALAVIFFIGFSMASPELKANYQEFGVETGTASQLVGGGLLTFYILFGIAVVGIVFTEIFNLVK